MARPSATQNLLGCRYAVVSSELGLIVWDLGFRVWGLGFRVWGLGFRVWGLGFWVWGLGCRDPKYLQIRPT